MLKPAKKVTLPDSIIEQLMQYIQEDLKPGDKLPSERRLTGFLGVGRTSLREALRTLEGVGVVEVKAGKGTFVSTDSNKIYRKPLELGVFSNKQSLKELFDARWIIEVGMMTLVAPVITKKELADCITVLEKMKALNFEEFGLFLDLDYQFHKILSKASKNGILIEFLNLTRQIINEERLHTAITEKGLKKSVLVHQAILDALTLGDVKTSVKAMEDHMEWTKELLELPR
ncbi:MAG: FadR family transcriptional regulator [Spirochaetales bacterium]|nr:FadR family transcriptional regulator [Spirochaetales bacterium]